jgi:hypothetical protein
VRKPRQGRWARQGRENPPGKAEQMR